MSAAGCHHGIVGACSKCQADARLTLANTLAERVKSLTAELAADWPHLPRIRRTPPMPRAQPPRPSSWQPLGPMTPAPTPASDEIVALAMVNAIGRPPIRLVDQEELAPAPISSGLGGDFGGGGASGGWEPSPPPPAPEPAPSPSNDNPPPDSSGSNSEA